VITEIKIEGFKSLEKVSLKLGKFNLFIGANASGKSNFFDALRVFQGLGYGFGIDEIFNGKPKSAGSDVWEKIRGGSAQAGFCRGEGEPPQSPAFSIIDRTFEDYPTFYSVGVSADGKWIRSERLIVGSEKVFDELFTTMKNQSEYRVTNLAGATAIERSGLQEKQPLVHSYKQSGLLSVEQKKALAVLLRRIGNAQRLEPSVEVLRDYSQSQSAARMGERGENFAALVKEVLSKRESHSAYLGWLRQLTPVELEDVVILQGALGEPMFALRECGRLTLAPVLSDGTLRFAAVAAAFFQPDMPDIITIEEIENGIHPNRLRLLVELLKSQSHVDGPQVFATTHSPVVLAWLEESDYETTFFCKRDEETGASIIRPLSEIPRLVELVKRSSLGELFTEGWMEGAF
jgi:energy-coupling factor transporter ATP-binding protein EcfA2